MNKTSICLCLVVFMVAGGTVFGAPQLTVTPGPTAADVNLLWTGAAGPFQVHRDVSPAILPDPTTLLTLTAGTTHLDAASLLPPGGIYYYRVVESSCGDNIPDLDEECDTGSMNSDTLPDACRTTCELPSCGDGVTDAGEECDDGGANSDTDPDACRTTCELPACGDGVIDTGEQCDDGNTADGDGCSAVCEHQWNVLLIIADDLGVDNLQAYHDVLSHLTVITPPATPNLDDIAANGVTFLRTWSNPSCTPTRAGLYSGFHAFEHELTSPFAVALDDVTGCGSNSLEETLASALGGAPALPGVLPSVYEKGLFGKWHVGGDCTDGNTYDGMMELGWDRYDGSFEDIKNDPSVSDDYCDWPDWVVDGALQTDGMGNDTHNTTYATDYVVDETLAWVNAESGSPWFATVAFNTPHTPLHDPATCSESSCGADPNGCFTDMVENMDTAVGELITGLGILGELRDTILIFIGDNGTQGDTVYSPPSSGPYGAGRTKGTVYQGGVHVPLIVADGCHVGGAPSCTPLVAAPGRYAPALVHTLDLFATVRDITGGTDDAGTYGRRTESMVPYLVNPALPGSRDILYTQASADCTIRDTRYKLILDVCDPAVATCELYDLQSDPSEGSDLLAGTPTSIVEAILGDLKTELTSLRSWSDPPCAYCGDAVVDSSEDCDDGGANSDTSPDACRTTCVAASCGDGVIDTGETCDDGLSNSDSAPDACRTTCVRASCGDGVIDTSEECDDGGANSDTDPDACRTTCELPACGDGVIDTGEECDDGNTSDGDGCSSVCEHQRNVLLIIADDLGVDTLQAYHSILSHLTTVTPPTTTNIDGLSSNGVTFWKAWSNPTCSPTRAGLYSGFHAFDHGINSPPDVNLDATGCGSTSLEEALTALAGAPALPGVLPAIYEKGLFGKWHVGGDCSDGNPYDTVLSLGWDYQDGSFEDIKNTTATDDYCNWPEWVINGTLQTDTSGPIANTTYATDYAVDEALTWIDSAKTSPWFATVAFNVPHTPLHDPATCDESPCSADPNGCFTDMVVDMDGAVGELLSGIEALGELSYTIVIFIGDNGTQATAVYSPPGAGPYPPTRTKGTLYEGGVHVPLIVADGCHLSSSSTCSPLIVTPGRYEAALAHTMDLFGTIRVLTKGTDDEATYGRATQQLVPYLVQTGLPGIRDSLYTQETDGCTIRGPRYKLLLPDCIPATMSCEFYDLQTDPTEGTDLLSGTLTPVQAAALNDLKGKLRALRGWPAGPFCP